jgi:phosphatidylserine/phosphatidylglycerophosphate/cardiolipin synthase-like enzyme
VFIPAAGTYVFADDAVWRYAPGRRYPDRGYPRPITKEFPGIFPRRLDAALVDSAGKLLLFRGDRYIRYDLARGRPLLGFPRRYADDWPGVFPEHLDAAICWGPDLVYLFHGDTYTSFSPRDARTRPGYPKPIAPNWPGLSGGPVRAALTLPDGRRLLVTDSEAQAYSEDGRPVDVGRLVVPPLSHADGAAREGASGAPVFRSRRLLESPARAELEAVAAGRLRLGRRNDPPYPAPVLSHSPAVTEIQRALIELGWPLPRFGADGRYGNETYATVLAYKRRHGILTAGGYLDGIVGVETISHIDAALPPAAPPPHPPQPDGGLHRWRTLLGPDAREGNDVVELIDGADTFRAMHAAIRTATGPGHYIYLLGWWLDLEEPLDPSVPGGRSVSTVRSLLTAASQHRVQVRVMLWDQPGRKNSAEVAFINTLANGAAVLDNHQDGPILGHLVGSQHQKQLVVKGSDGLVGFCGGVDINCDRVKTKSACHKEVTDHVVVQASGASGNEGQPLHDVHCRIAGPAAHDLLQVFIKRWHANDAHARLDAAKGALRGLSEPLPRATGGALVRVGSTFNASATMLGTGKTTFRVRTVQEILLTVIDNARRYVYIEEQYMISLCAAEAIKRVLEHVEHVTILIAPSEICDMPRRWEFRRRFLDHICTSPLCHKVTVVTRAPTFDASGHATFGPHTYIHAKMLIVDDEVAVIGSANMNRRGWEHDAEVVAAVAGPARDGTSLARRLRMRLWAEHLGVPYSAVSDPVASQVLWRTSPGRVTLYNPLGGTDSFLEQRIPEDVIDPAFPLASAPCCRMHGLSCPSRAPRTVAQAHPADTELPFAPIEVGTGIATDGRRYVEVAHEQPAPFEESFELLEAAEESASASHVTGKEADAGAPEGLAVRILWPALGFPGVIAPRTGQTAGSSTPSSAHQASVLLLSNRPTLTAEEAARNLRIVPWEQRTRRYVASGQPGSFAAAELAVRTDSPASALFQAQHDDRGDVVRFGGDGPHNAITASLARSVRGFYERQGLRYLHEIRISEAACAKLPDGQYHMFWNGSADDEGSPSAEMKLLLDEYALPTRRAELKPDGRHERLNITTLVDEYRFEFGALHPPYQRTDSEKRFTEVLHPLFVRRSLVTRPGATVTIAHVTDTHVNVRADVYEENLKSNDPPITWDGAHLFYQKSRIVRYNNFNRSFDRVYADAKRGADLILMTGDLIDYGRGPLGLVDNGRYRNRLDEDWTYQSDRNWFLFYYLLASKGGYSIPVYTILGNHDWRLNPYPPFAPGAPDPPVMLHNYRDFTADEQKAIIQAAHGHGHDTRYSYSELGAERFAKAVAGFFTGELAFDGSPLETSVASVVWYLLLINPFLDYAFPLPGGQQVLMLDWGKDEEIYNFESARDWMEYSQRAKNCLSSPQEWLLTDFARAPGNAKVIGIHAPPLGPADRWTDDDLRQGEKLFRWNQDSRMRNPTDGKVVKIEKHSLCAIAPKGAPFGIAAVYGSIVQRREPFIRQVGESASGIRLVLSGHIHRDGLLVAYPPTNDRESRLLRSVTYAEASDSGRGVGPRMAAIRRDGTCVRASPTDKCVRAFPAPLYVNTTSAGPRGNQYLPAETSEGYVRNNVAPGWTRVELAADGTVRALSAQQLTDPTSARATSQPPAHEALLARA